MEASFVGFASAFAFAASAFLAASFPSLAIFSNFAFFFASSAFHRAPSSVIFALASKVSGSLARSSLQKRM